MALKVMNKYRFHHDVIVYYDPKDPQQAVLQPGDTGEIFIPFIVGGLLVLFGVLTLYGQSLEINRGNESHIYQGQIYQNQGKMSEALWEYSQAIKINPYLARGYSCRGGLYLQQENWDQAIADFSWALSIDPKDAFVYFTLANAYLGKKQYDKALVNMQKAMELGFEVKPEILEYINKKLA